MNFQEKLDQITVKNNSLVCVGLDPDIEKIPTQIRGKKNSLFEFNKAIIDKTYDLVCVFKPNSAFYEAMGTEGIEQLKMTCDYIRTTYPEIPVVLDAKRADIGNTNKGYARFAFEFLQVDAVTLLPYLGLESFGVFFDYKDKGIIIGCRSSNEGAKEYQDLAVDGMPLYQRVAKDVVEKWNKNNNCMLFVGATYPEELAEVRKIAGDMTFLVPGVGAQEGSSEKTVKAGLNSKKAGMMINSSRGIIYAGSGEDFAEKAREATQLLQVEINKYRV